MQVFVAETYVVLPSLKATSWFLVPALTQVQSPFGFTADGGNNNFHPRENTTLPVMSFLTYKAQRHFISDEIYYN